MSGLPRRARGRSNGAAEEAYQADLLAFCERILEIRSGLDFAVGSRGWCYLLEGQGVITKGEFDQAEALITRCRKDGNLPLDICAEDGKRSADGVEDIDETDIEGEVDSIIRRLGRAHLYYTPFSFWEDLDVYVEIAVEKSDLKSLFSRVAEEFYLVIQSIGGWADVNGRAGMMRRFQTWEAKGRKCVLLLCTDFDPGGAQITNCLRKNLQDLEKAVGWSPRNLIIDRFGLTFDFIERHGLTWIDNLETGSGKNLADPKHPDHYKDYVQSYLKRFGARKCEANALVARPEAGRELCRQAIRKYLPSTAVADYDERLVTVREELRLAVVERMTRGEAEP